MVSGSCAFAPVLRDSDDRSAVWQLIRCHDLAVTGWVGLVNAPLPAFVVRLNPLKLWIFSVGSRDLQRLGAAIIATVVAASCAVAQETVTRTPEAPPATGGRRRGNSRRGSCPTATGVDSAPFPPGLRQSPQSRGPGRSTGLAPQPGDAIWLRNKDGQLVPTVYGATFEQFVDSPQVKKFGGSQRTGIQHQFGFARGILR